MGLELLRMLGDITIGKSETFATTQPTGRQTCQKFVIFHRVSPFSGTLIHRGGQ
jgi:hypothetical protein